jgi:hypothetical protein
LFKLYLFQGHFEALHSILYKFSHSCPSLAQQVKGCFHHCAGSFCPEAGRAGAFPYGREPVAANMNLCGHPALRLRHAKREYFFHGFVLSGVIKDKKNDQHSPVPQID